MEGTVGYPFLPSLFLLLLFSFLVKAKHNTDANGREAFGHPLLLCFRTVIFHEDITAIRALLVVLLSNVSLVKTQLQWMNKLQLRMRFLATQIDHFIIRQRGSMVRVGDLNTEDLGSNPRLGLPNGFVLDTGGKFTTLCKQPTVLPPTSWDS